MSSSIWSSVTPENPCPVCGKKDWCSMSEEGHMVICRREIDDPVDPEWEFDKTIQNKNQVEEYIWKLSQQPDESTGLGDNDGDPNDSAEIRDVVYESILNSMELFCEHRQELNQRGLTDCEIDSRQYRSIPADKSKLIDPLLSTYLIDCLDNVPGFYQDDQGNWDFNAPRGIVIPVRNLQQQIVALKIRKTDPYENGKYCYVSSKSRGGVGSGAPVHVPIFDVTELSEDYDERLKEIRITEGELKSDIATALSGVLTIGLSGVQTYRDALPLLCQLEPDTVRLAFDSDYRTNPAVARALINAVSFYEADFEVVVENWSPKKGKGIDDLLANGHQPWQIRKKKLKKLMLKLAKRFDIKPEMEREVIFISPDEHEVNAQALRTLAELPLLYQRNNALVTVKEGSDPGIVVLSDSRLRDELSRAIKWMKKGKTGKPQPDHPPIWAINSILKRGFYPSYVRTLEGVTSSPVLRPDGSLFHKPGYDPVTRLHYAGKRKKLPIEKEPSCGDVQAAVRVLEDLVADFPFQAECHKASWFAFLLTLIGRHTFQGPAPLFLIDSNTPGTGKGLLTDITALIALGKRAAIMSNPGDNEEARKKITSLAMCGCELVCIDNVDGKLGGQALEAAITGGKWVDRQLGGNQMVEIDLNLIWAANGNNVQPTKDLLRRILHIRLTSPLERPEERSGFRHRELRSWVESQRDDLLAAGLTILRGYFAAGCPEQEMSVWGSFESWSDRIRAAVIWAGLSDPYESKRELSDQEDLEGQTLHRFLVSLSSITSDNRGLSASQIIQHANESLVARNENAGALRESIIELCSTTGEMPSPNSLGRKLGHLKERVVGGMRLTKSTVNNTSLWSVITDETDS